MIASHPLTQTPVASGDGQRKSWDDSPTSQGEHLRLLSLFTSALDLDPMIFLRSAYGQERFYWSEPAGEGMTVAGVGVAAEIRVPPILKADEATALPGHRFNEVESRARRLFNGALFQPASLVDGQRVGQRDDHPARPRLIGGFAFQDDFVPDNTWSVFSPAQFILPHFQLVQQGAQRYLTINALVAASENVEESVEGMREALAARLEASGPAKSRPIQRAELRYPMTFQIWRAMIERATQAIHDELLEKVVLSRVCEARSQNAIDAATVLDYLEKQYPDSYRFVFEPTPHHAFFGATPELLIEKSGDRIRTMSLAGSIGRGTTAEEDADRAEQLLASTKDRHEHRLVVRAIRTQLADYVAELRVPDAPTVLRLRNIQHLLTPIDGCLKRRETGVLSLARQLHPTPAMGGAPAARAMAFLREAEPVPRGWYAAPIGWLDAQNDGAFAVAIRSAVTQHDRAWLYAGAGIVGDSRPDAEWAETALKFRPMLGALGVDEVG